MTLDTVAKFSAIYILTVVATASGYTLWEGYHPRTTVAAGKYQTADR